MADKKEFRWARLVIGVLVFGLVVVALVLQSLFAVRIEPVVVSAAPPEFIASILAEREGAVADEELDDVERIVTDEVRVILEENDTELEDVVEVPSPGPNYTVLSRDAVLNGASVEKLLQLLRDEDSEVRINTAFALGQAFMLTMARQGDDAEYSGYDLRVRFWEQVGDDVELVRNALYEGLVYSVEWDEYNNIPFVIAYMPGQNEETLELLAWASNNHQSAQMRNSAMYYVVNIDPKSERTTEVLEQRRNDPSLRIRIDVLGHRLTRWFN